MNNVFHDIGSWIADDNGSLFSLRGVSFKNNIVSHARTRRNVEISPHYSLFWETAFDYSRGSKECLFSRPHFTDPDNGDFTLKEGYSPAIDAGDPVSRYDDFDGSRNDMGAYGGPGGDW